MDECARAFFVLSEGDVEREEVDKSTFMAVDLVDGGDVEDPEEVDDFDDES